MKLPRRQFLHLAAGATALLALSRIAWAQAYPSRPVRIIVPFAPAGPSDIVARLMGQWLSERLGQQFVIDNRPGGGGNTGTEAVVRASPDGYTLLLCGTFNAINATLYDKLNFVFLRDIAPVAGVLRGFYVLVVNPSVPTKSVPEFIAYAKAHPRKLNMASGGVGTGGHIAGELFKMMTGVDMVHVVAGPRSLICSARRCRSCSPPLCHRLGISKLAGCARSQWPRGRAWTYCRISRPWLSLCRATKRVFGSASAHRRPRRSRSSTSSIRRSTRLSTIPR